MTNKNISGLTGATTPLAGTELLAVWDASGTTKSVSIANLTAGRTVAVDALNATTSISFGTGTGASAGLRFRTGASLSSYAAIYPENVTPSDINFTLLARYTGAETYLNSTSSVSIGVNGATVIGTVASGVTITGTAKITTGLAVGGATPGAGGIAFPATAVDVADANTLDDYEEGTWTPSLGGSATYLAQGGTYTKIGRVVHFKGILYINAIGTGSTTQITGLPFAIASGGGAVCAAPAYGGIATAIASMNLNIAGSTIYCQSNVGNATSNQTANAIFQNSTYLEFSGTYQV